MGIKATVGRALGPSTRSSPALLASVMAARRREELPALGVRKRYVCPVPCAPGRSLLPKSKMRCQGPLVLGVAFTGFQVTQASKVALGPSVETMPAGSWTYWSEV